MVSSTFSRSQSARFTSPRVSPHRSSLTILSLILILVALTLALGSILYCSYIRYFTHLRSEFINPNNKCDVFEGKWVRDDTYPLYNSSECPFAERGFNCLANGRTDTEYQRWRWKPDQCDVPKFDSRVILERLRGKRVVFVGDSMSRTQWESLMCMLMTGVEDKRNVYEVNGNQISKTIRHVRVRFRTFHLSVEFFRSVFLVRQGPPPKHVPMRVRSTLRLDEINRRWVDSDILNPL